MTETDADGNPRIRTATSRPVPCLSWRDEMRRVQEWCSFMDSPAFQKAKDFGLRMEAEAPHHKAPRFQQADGFRPGTLEATFDRPPYVAPVRRESLYEWSHDENGQLYQLGDADETPLSTLEASEAGQFALSAREQWEKILLRETGKLGDPEQLAKSEKRKKELTRLSYQTAFKLEEAGVEAFDRNEWQAFEFWPLSGTVAKSPPLRRINILPLVAQAHRAKLVRALEAELERFPFARMFTFTSGKRVPLSGLRDRIQFHHRRLSKLNYFLRKKLKIEIFWRSTELGTPRNFDVAEANDQNAGTISRNEDGEVTFHVHSHCCVRFLNGKPFTKDEWEVVKSKIKSRWKHIWDDSGLVGRTSNGDRKPIHIGARELVKYVTKPTELDKLNAQEMGELYHALYRLRMVTPMGQLKKELKARRDAKKALYREPTPDGPVWQEGPDFNRHAISDPTLKDALEATEGRLNVQSKDKSKDGDSPILLASLPPSYPPGRRIKEPKFRILCKRWDKDAAMQMEAIRDAIALTADLYAAAVQLEAAETLAAELFPLDWTRGNQLSTDIDYEPPPRPPTLPNFEKSAAEPPLEPEIEPPAAPEKALETQGALSL